MSGKEGGFDGWLQRVRRTGEFSDITVVLKNEEFRLHSLPLLNASTYFRDIWSSSPPSHTRILELPDLAEKVDLEAFAMAVDFCYCMKPHYTFENVGGIRAVGQFLGMPDLLESTKKYLYANVFGSWRLSAAFLEKYQRVEEVAVDEYIETRCVRTIVSGCTKAFVETRQLCAPMSSLNWKTVQSPSQTLTEILARVAHLPDRYVQDVIDGLVKCHLNVNIKSRQGRYARGWIDNLINEECKTSRSRFWVIVCLSRMLQKDCSNDRPWLELSSQYWCALLENADRLAANVDLDEEMREKLNVIKSFLEFRIGGSLDEIDEYLHSYRFSPQTLLSLVTHFKEKEVGEREREEVAKEVDSCLWSHAECGSISPADFCSLFDSLPPSSRQNHDILYKAIKSLVERHRLGVEDAQMLWRLIDVFKLSPSIYDKALKNPAFLCQPHVLETVLQKYSQELEQIGDAEDNTDRGRERQNLKQIMHKVIKASLTLLEENSRRSEEIIELQKQYAALIRGKIDVARDSCESSSDLLKPLSLTHPTT